MQHPSIANSVERRNYTQNIVCAKNLSFYLSVCLSIYLSIRDVVENCLKMMHRTMSNCPCLIYSSLYKGCIYCMYVQYTCMYVCTSMHVYMYVCIRACMYVIYIYIHIQYACMNIACWNVHFERSYFRHYDLQCKSDRLFCFR